MDHNVWVNRIVGELFQRDKRRLNMHLEELIEANHQAGGPPHGFLFGGQFHTNLPLHQQRQAEKKLLAPALHVSGRAYMKDISQTNAEKGRLTQGLSILLAPCQGLQDIRDALPDVVVSLFPELSSLSRMREEGWPFRDKPLQMHAFKQTAEILGFYVANRLLY
jgi:hypothetical protein